MDRRLAAALGLLVLALAAPLRAATVRVAVAASFAPALEDLAASFAQASGHRLAISGGASGKLYAQIAQGAPFDVFLSADAERPRRLEERGLAVAGSRFTYARGRLVLWSARPGLTLGPEALRRGDFAHLAIADPAAAPYGEAALATLRALGVEAALRGKLVRGESVGQAFAFVHSRAAELGFVAAAQLVGRAGGSRWDVPAALHGPIEQQAVLLRGAAAPGAARALLAFLASPAVRARLGALGYDAP